MRVPLCTSFSVERREMNLISENSDLEFRVLGFGNFAVEVLSGKNLLESVSLSVGPLDVVTRPRLWLKTTSEKGPHLSCVVFTEETTLIFFWQQTEG